MGQYGWNRANMCVYLFCLSLSNASIVKCAEIFSEPTGQLFGEPALKPGEKRKWESWEYPIYTGFVVFVGMMIYAKLRPQQETSMVCSIPIWCLIIGLFGGGLGC